MKNTVLNPLKTKKTYRLDPAYDAEGLMQLYVIDERPYYKHFETPRSQKHSHSHNEILYITKGEGNLFTTEQVYNFTAGDIFLFSSNEYHEIITQKSKPYVSSFTLLFDSEFILNPRSGLIDKGYADLFINRKPASNRLNPKSPYIKELKENITEISKLFLNQVPGTPLLIKGKLLCTLAIIYMHFDLIRKPVDAKVNHQNFIKIKESLKYIHENLGSDLTVSDISKIFLISENYYVNLFKKIHATTPKKYILNQRLNMAVELIIKNEYNLLEISNLCGFNSNAYFSKCFKERFLVTPSEFKDKL